MTSSEPRPLAAPQYTSVSGRAVGVLIALCGAFFLDSLDSSMVNVAIPDIDRSLHLGSTLHWVVAGYVLGYGGFLLFGGKLADIAGRRRVFLIALAVFVVFSALGGIAWNGEVLIASRFLKGVAAAFTAPAALSLLTTSFAEGPARTKAISMYTTAGAAGFTLGLAFGGVLTEIHWRATFFAPGVLGALLLVLGAVLIPSHTGESGKEGREPLDVVGAVTVTLAMLALVFGLTEAPIKGWDSGLVLTSFAVALVSFAAFIHTERTHSHPLVPGGILVSWSHIRANIAALGYVGAWAAAQYLATLYMQDTRGWSPLETAATFWPCGVLGFFVAPFLPRVVARLTLLGTLAAGLAMTGVSYVLLLTLGLEDGYWLGLFPAFALVGIGFILVFSSVSVAATAGVPAELQGVASAMLQTSIQFGSALFLAISTAVAVEAGRAGDSEMSYYHGGWWVSLAALGTVLVIVVIGLFTDRRGSAHHTHPTEGIKA